MNQSGLNKKISGRTASKEVRRQQLIDATIESIASRGFSGTTIAVVSKGAKLSQGIINLHFTNKETLFVETLGYLAREHYERWSNAQENAGSDPGKQLAAIIEVDFDPVICTPKKLAVWFAFWGQAKQRPSYLKIHDKFDKQRTKEINRLCTVITNEGNYRNIDAASTARSLVALVDGLWLNQMLFPKSSSRKQGRHDCFAFLADAFPNHFPRLTK
jgi:TetR/AcrR family transcriptional repressor of bet genes